MTKNPFRYFKTSPEIIQLAVMMYVRFPLSLRNVEDLLHERGIDICHESVRVWGHASFQANAKSAKVRRQVLPLGPLPNKNKALRQFRLE